MARGLDHIVHAVRDLDAAADLYRRLGFTVGGRNRHPWGTHNRIVQFPGFFIELLTVGEPEKISAGGPQDFSFGAFNRDFLARGEGLSMLALESRDAQVDAASFKAAGIGDFPLFHFERVGARPRDGASGEVKVAFSLAFARDPAAADAGFFACQHHHPENFWSPAVQVHANTVEAAAGVDLAAENPSDHHIFLSAFTGERELLATSTGIRIATPRGEIRVMEPAAFRMYYGIAPPTLSRGARIAALRFAVRDFSAAITALKAGSVDAQVRMGRIVVAPHSAMGATLVFEAT